jgi:hypothetical protein
MLTLLMAFAAATGTGDQMILSEVCQVGRAALRDLPGFNANRDFRSYYAKPGGGRQDLLDVCPSLLPLVTRLYPLADDKARAEASIHGPVAGQSAFTPTQIFSVAPPIISPDGKSAVVTMRYECSGLCGGYTDFSYVRTPAGWRQEAAKVTVVS